MEEGNDQDKVKIAPLTVEVERLVDVMPSLYIGERAYERRWRED